MKRICIIGISGKLGRYMLEHALARGYEVTGVCRPESVGKLDKWRDRITLYPGRTDDRAVVAKAVKGCDGVLTVLAPWGMSNYASGTAQAVLDLAEPHARVVFSCGWHITRDGKDRYSWKLRTIVHLVNVIGRAVRVVDLKDQVEACRRIFDSDRDYTVVRGCDLEEGESEGLPVWSAHVGDPVLASNLVRRTDFALFMVHALTDPALSRQAPAIVGCNTESARTHAPDHVRHADGLSRLGAAPA
ncbi:NAD(P)-dependent oxidoreductase [Oceanomicrobium pacificus]|uniref:NAD(P)H-binding protein n=1 Tax=Oceanomicrobium pacificus TaxID=2692916 RepID=A0A6B0TU54_9RHOB|nr:NAD(P)H-binding protein [Oceanomicrobium pacificus]MXU65178.1 NAD(P)H-binding protein [Oceanomicrobium pacificus]